MVGRLLLVITGLIFQCLFTYTFAGTTTLNDAEFKAKCDDVLRIEGITNPTDQESRLVRRIVVAKHERDHERDRATNAENEKRRALTDYHGLKIPLDVRNYVYMIEERFGDTVNSTVPLRIHKLAIQTKNYDSHIRNRMYKWWNIFDQKKDDMYVELVLEELEKDFTRLYPEAKIGDDTYNKYILSVGEAIARACDRVSDLIAHIQSGASIKLEKLGFFDAAVDRKLTMFYNALVGTQIEIMSTTTTAANEPSSKV